MADRVEAPIIVVPAGTTVAAPQTTTLSLRDAVLDRIEVRIPPGPSGLMGFAFLHSGVQVIPFTGGQWIVSDNESLDWVTDNYPTGDKWSIRAYNTDVYPHSIYLRLHFREIGAPPIAASTPLQIVALSPVVVTE